MSDLRRKNTRSNSSIDMAILHKGWKRLGVVLTVLWLVLVCGYAVLEWDSWFDKPGIFFPVSRVIREYGLGEEGRYFDRSKLCAVAVIPIMALWTFISLVPAIKWARDGFKLQ